MTFPDRWHHEDGTHRGTAQSADGHELELFEAGFRQHVADGHVHVKPPRRRWRLHFQLPHEAKSVRSFEDQLNAEKMARSVRRRGGQAMVEDRWPSP